MNTRSVRNFRPAPAVMAAVTVVAASLLGGCTSHYKVTDPASGKVFYTTDIDRERSGVITFEDERTDADVTLTSSEVQKISKKEFKAAVKK